jgi:hypothetical protein
MYSDKKLSWWLYGIGVFIVLVAHAYMLVIGIDPSQMMAHAILNLVAVVLLVSGWLTAKV